MNRGLSERYLADDYALAINGCLKQATALLARQEPARAGQLFASARDNYPGSRALTARVSLTPTQLDEQIETCAEQLMAQGLATYRSGELGKAIRIWEQILTFAPQHEAARNAVRITELQLANLKVIESAPTAR